VPADDSDELSRLVDRLQAGDKAAGAELIRVGQGRLELLARKMLRQYPGVRRWEQTADILQNALLRLHRALQEVAPDSSAGFIKLASQHIRWALIDLARHYSGPEGLGHNHASGVRPGEPESQGGIDPADRRPSQADLDRWFAFHEAVEKLPKLDREVFEQWFYFDLTCVEIGRQLGIDERTVRRHLRSARERLKELLGDNPPF
jgi:RNA polymerase sigma factor (sigma-70 family)